MAKITVNKHVVAFLQEEQAKGNFITYQKGAKYDLVEGMILNAVPIPVSNIEDVTEAQNGKEYQYGSMCRVTTGVDLLDGDFPYRTKGTREAVASLPVKTGKVNVGVYRLREAIVFNDGRETIPAGKISRRVDVAE